MKRKQALIAEAKKLQAERDKILDIAAKDRSEEQSQRLAEIMGVKNDDGHWEGGRLDEIQAELDEIAARDEADRNLVRSAHPQNLDDDPGADKPASVRVIHDNAAERPFESSGDYFRAVIQAMTPGGSGTDERLKPLAAATGYGSSDGADGGFLVPKEFSTRLLEMGMEESMLLPLCADQPVGEMFDGVEMPYWNDYDRSGGAVHGGVQVYRRAEAATVTATQGELEMLKLDLEDLMGLAYVSARLMRDGTALGAWVERSFRTAFAFKTDDEILNGTGAGQMLGVITSGNGSLITVTKETGQVAASLDYQNLLKMRNRLNPSGRRNAVWVMNLDLEPKLQSVHFPVGTGGVPVYLPANGLRDEPFDTLFGRPILISEHAPAAGTAGDISLHDFSQYLVITKGGLEAAESMHVRFIYGEQTLRFMYRINGRPTWRSAKTRHKGTNTVSPHVALGART